MDTFNLLDILYIKFALFVKVYLQGLEYYLFRTSGDDRFSASAQIGLNLTPLP